MDAERDNTIQKGRNSQREGPVGRYMRTKARKDILSRWISVDSNTGQTQGFPSFCLFRCSCVLCVFLFSIPGTPSRLAILSGHPSLSPRAAGVLPGSALNLVSRMSPCAGLYYSLAALGETITCSICYDGVVESRIHRGSSHILDSM